MKKETNKKTPKWLWPIIGVVAVLIVVGVVLALVLGGGQQAAKGDGTQYELYWNVDRESFIEADTGFSAREPEEDGLYHIRFSHNGKLVELKVADKKLVNVIDSMDAQGLAFDSDGLVIDTVPASEFMVEVGKRFYVKEQREDGININSSVTLTGLDLDLKFTEGGNVYDVTSEAEVPGEPGQARPMDTVYAYGPDKETVSHVFIVERNVTSDLYWRVAAKYDTTKGKTTREPDENGVYSMEFACKGEIVTLKCKDINIVNTIDATGRYGCIFGFEFDEEGYIIRTIAPVTALPGYYFCDACEVIGIDGNKVTLERQMVGGETGKVYTITITAGTEIYDVSPVADPVGAPTQLRLGDRVTCYDNLDHELDTVFVLNRLMDSPMYYNLERKYAYGETTREPNAAGYYVFQLAVNGGVHEYMTRDKKIASKLDSFGYKCVGLKTNGYIIEAVYDPVCVSGYFSFGANMYVTGMTGPVVSAESADGTQAANGVMHADCKIYNVSGIGVEVGAPDELLVGDQIMGYPNAKGEILYIFIISRTVDAPLYWSYERKYDDKTEQTTREPDADGYYVFRVASNGKDMTIKTKSKAIATKIDAYNPQLFAAYVSGGIIQEVFPPKAATGGAVRSNTFVVRSITSEEIITESQYGSGITPLKPHEDMTVYNVSTGYQKSWGEETYLKVGDIVCALTDRENKTVFMWVRTRKISSDLYWNQSRRYDAAKGETTRVPDANGWYVFNLAVNGTVKQFKTKSKDIASQVDSYRVAFGLLLNGNEILRAVDANFVIGIRRNNASWLDVTAINGKEVTLQQNIADAADLGTVSKMTLASSYKVYDVSHYNDAFGAEVKLKVGDRIQSYVNEDNEVTVIYIVRAGNREKGAIGYCEHCKQDVFWQPWRGEAFPEGNGHYHLTDDINFTSQMVIGGEGKTHDVVLDLNGYSITCGTHRSFLVWHGGKFALMDSVGGGTISAKGPANANAGNIMVFSATFNMYGGILTQENGTEISVNQGGNVFVTGATSKFNMYGGTIQNGLAKTGGNIYIQTGEVNLLGGTVKNGVTSGIGGNVYLGTGATVNVAGATLTDGVALRGGNIGTAGAAIVNISGGVLENGQATWGGNLFVFNNAKADITGGVIRDGVVQTSGGNIYISEDGEDTSGVLPVLNISGGVIKGGLRTSGTGSNLESYRAAEVNISGGTIDGDVDIADGTVLKLSGSTVIDAGLTRGLEYPATVKPVLGTLNSDAKISISAGGVFTEELSNPNSYLTYFEPYNPDMSITVSGNALCCGLVRHCDHCNQDVLWSTFSGKEISASGHYYMPTDTTYAGGALIVGAANAGIDAVLDLYGNDLTVNTRWQVRTGNALSIMDSKTGGIVNAMAYYSSSEPAQDGGLITVWSGSSFSLYGGTIQEAANVRPYKNGLIFLSGPNSVFNMYGGTVVGGTHMETSRLGGAVYMANAAAEFNMTGGTITAGSADKGDTVYVGHGKVSITEDARIEGGVWVEDCASVTVSGTPVIQKAADGSSYSLYLAPGKLLTVGELEDGAAIGITGSGLIISETDTAKVQGWINEEYFVTDSDSDTFEVTADGLTIKSNYTVDYNFTEGGTFYCPVCKTDAQWYPLPAITAGTFLPQRHYYVDGTVESTSFYKNDASNKGTYCIHLNNGTINSSSNEGNFSVGNGSVINILGNGTVSGARLATLYTGTVNVYSGSVTTSKTAIMMTGDYSTCNIYGGTVNGIDAAKGNLTIAGGTVNSNVSVYSALTSATFSGAPVVANLVVKDDRVLTIGDLTQGAKLNINFTDSGNSVKMTGKADEAIAAGYIVPKEAGKTITKNGEVYQLAVDGHMVDCPHCAGTDLVEFTEWDGTGALTTGHYYLAGDTTAATARITGADSAGNNVVIDLNGNALTVNTRWQVMYGNTLSVMDSATGGTVNAMGFNGSTESGGLISIIGTFNLYSGTIQEAATCRTYKDGLIYVYRAGVFNMHGGTITPGTKMTATNGAAIHMADSSVAQIAKCNIYGGTVNGGTAANGGAIYVGAKGKLVANGGTIGAGTVTGNGSSIYAAANGVLEIATTVVVAGETFQAS